MLRLFSRARAGGAARGSACIYAGWKDYVEGETRGARASSESALTLWAKCRLSESFKGSPEFAESREGRFGLLRALSASPTPLKSMMIETICPQIVNAEDAETRRRGERQKKNFFSAPLRSRR